MLKATQIDSMSDSQYSWLPFYPGSRLVHIFVYFYSMQVKYIQILVPCQLIQTSVRRPASMFQKEPVCLILWNICSQCFITTYKVFSDTKRIFFTKVWTHSTTYALLTRGYLVTCTQLKLYCMVITCHSGKSGH